MTFTEAMAGVRHWLKKNNLNTDGMEVTFTFPDKRDQYSMEAALCLEYKHEGYMRLNWPDNTRLFDMKISLSNKHVCKCCGR